jgi:HSP20 family protein
MSHMISGRNHLVPRRVDFFSEISRDLDQVWNEVFGSSYLNGKKSRGYPALDALRFDNSLTIQYAVPGVKLEDLTVEVSNDEKGKLLTVIGKLSSEYKHQEDFYQIRELSSQEFRRSVRLPEDVSDDEPEAILKDGVLRLNFKTLSSKEPEPAVKKIQVKSN